MTQRPNVAAVARATALALQRVLHCRDCGGTGRLVQRRWGDRKAGAPVECLCRTEAHDALANARSAGLL